MHEAITTTEAKAKALRPVAERLITFAKRGDVAARREVLKVVPDRDVVHKLFSELGPRFSERTGGYTRILKPGSARATAPPWPVSSSSTASRLERGGPGLGGRAGPVACSDILTRSLRSLAA